MTTKSVAMQSGRVTTEGDSLYYEVRGQGIPLIMIPGGGGDGDSYTEGCCRRIDLLPKISCLSSLPLLLRGKGWG